MTLVENGRRFNGFGVLKLIENQRHRCFGTLFEQKFDRPGNGCGRGGGKFSRPNVAALNRQKASTLVLAVFSSLIWKKRQGSGPFVKAGFASVVLPMRRLPEMMTMRLASSSTWRENARRSAGSFVRS